VSSRSRLAAVRARLDLPTSRRAAGLLDGRHRSLFKGHGQDVDDLQLYVPGQDVGDIDWKASARTGAPVVRRFLRDAALDVVLVVDTGREMAATAAGGQTKAQVAAECCALVAAVAHGRGDRVALVAGDAERLVRRPARASSAEIEVMLRALDPMASPQAPPSDLGPALRALVSTLVRRSLVVIVTDEARPGPEHEPALKRLRVRHEVMVIGVLDLPPVGHGADAAARRRRAPVADVDGSAPLPAFLRGRPEVERAVAAAAAERRDAVERMLRHRAVPRLLVGHGDDAARALARLNRRQRHAG
jgi:uncharacterized protein (DUF58 family)